MKKLAFLWLSCFFLVAAAFPMVIRGACDGYCADRRVGGGTFNGCCTRRDANDEVVCVICQYAGQRSDGTIVLTVEEQGDCSGVECRGDGEYAQ